MSQKKETTSERMQRMAASRTAPAPTPVEVPAGETPTPAPVRGRGGRTAPAGEGSARAFQPTPRQHTRRVTLDLTDEDHRALSLGRIHDGVPISERLRALVALWQEDPELAERVRKLARGEA